MYSSIDHNKTQAAIKQTGAHYTPSLLGDFVATNILSAYSTKPNFLRVLDPAVGSGDLLVSFGNSSKQELISVELNGFDTNFGAVTSASERLKSLYPELPVEIKQNDFLEYASKHFCQTNMLPLFSTETVEPFDVVISNPPYIRTQVLGAEKAQYLSNKFGLSGRIDIFQPFIMSICHVLKEGGIAGIIVSNRFLTTKSGSDIRSFIYHNFDIFHIWDFGDTQLFEAAVLPCVLLLRKKSSRSNYCNPLFSSIYHVFTSPELNLSATSSNVIDALDHNGNVSVIDTGIFNVKHGKLAFDGLPENIWRLERVSDTCHMNIIGRESRGIFSDFANICVGIKTTADKVFIDGKWDDLPESKKPEVLYPLITHHIAGRYFAQCAPVRRVLYTHESIGGRRRSIDLDKFPNAKLYLESNRSVLESRKYVIEAGRNWYEIWVPHHPELWSLPKIVFRDISEKPMFWLDMSGSIVNGDCYWLTLKTNTNSDILYLILAVANSTFIEFFYDTNFNNKLYSGRRRFITQYVEKFPLPDIDSDISKQIVSMTKTLLSKNACALPDFEDKLDLLVWDSFKISRKEILG
ncbi:MAG: N-6 DNA methylase [Chitinispirillaceae bacterium]|jgi:tRNA1(Val) A37 N6-methylase TrmN6